MAAPTIADMLKYANLQMAAEALYSFDTKKRDPASLTPGDHYFGAIQSNWLTDGNEHASRFTQTEATKFASEWTVVDHLSNTTTGFSGTLFKNNATNELVMSIRSTEFLDDAVRDSYGTNKLELKDHGWAFGQISDMEAWYAQLSKAGGPLAGKHFSVTGYSLGGHLATAFNLLRQEDGTIGNVDQVVTFNGAGNNRGQTTVFGEFLLSAGMQSNAEVLLGTRTVAEYLRHRSGRPGMRRGASGRRWGALSIK